MENKGPVSVTIVNRVYPPDKGVISEAPSDLAKYLDGQGVEVKIVHTDGVYPGGGASGEVIGEIHKINSIYDGKSKLLRFFTSLIEGRKLIKKALEVNKGVVIVMTSPPLLSYWAARIFNKHKTPWIYWSMDIFPEAFAAGGLTAPSNPLYKHFYKQKYDNPPNGLIALGELQSEYLIEKYQKKLPEALLPCGVFLNSLQKTGNENEVPEWKEDSNKIVIGYIGNLGEAHSVEFIKQVMDNLVHTTQKLILVVYGSKAHHIKNYYNAEQHKGIQFFDFIPRSQLKYIDLHLVSLLKEWVHLCVPSKLVSAVHNGSIFLYFGKKESDSWHYLKKAGWIIEDFQNSENDIKAFLRELSFAKIIDKRAGIGALPEAMTENTRLAYKNIYRMIQNILSNG